MENLPYYIYAALAVVVIVSNVILAVLGKKGKATLEIEQAKYEQLLEDAIVTAENSGVATGEGKKSFAFALIKATLVAFKEFSRTDDEIKADIDAKVAVTKKVNYDQKKAIDFTKTAK